ncbi:MAG TPA: MFS transporter [Acidimicrobiia bacterium]|nr:MFS transporter [Acidimicrobiia bacterium]
MTSQALFSAGYVTMVSVLGLLAADLTGTDTWAGLPNAALTLGTAVMAAPLARRALAKGRRPALWAGYLIGAVGAVVGFILSQSGVFIPFLLALVLVGTGQTAALQSRFAAADLATPEERGRVISLVVWVGALGGVVGPSLGAWENAWGLERGFRTWTAPLLVSVLLLVLAALVVAIWLRPDPLLTSQRQQADTTPRPTLGTTWGVIRTRPLALLGIGAIALSQAAMVAVMTMTPLHMRDHGQAELSGAVIALHVLGMFGLSPVVGRIVDRYGPLRSIRLGAAILGTGVLAAVIAGYQPVLIFAGLFLLGLGWSFGLIGGSSLLVAASGDEYRVASQGLADAVLSVLGGSAAFASGFVKESFGFHWLSNLAFALALVVAIWASSRLRARALTASA